MKKFIKSLFVSIVLMTYFFSLGIGYAATAPSSISKIHKVLSSDTSNDCYIIGKFTIVHTKDESIANTEILNKALDFNKQSEFSIKIGLIHKDNGITYSFLVKPVVGSDLCYYREKQLTENTNDPYWVLKVPAGTYEITDFTCTLILDTTAYMYFREPIMQFPVSRAINRTINFTTKPKQIIYIGDYDINLKTYICLIDYKSTIYHFKDIKINLNDNLEAAKTSFINEANDKVKEKINEFEFISIL